MKYFKVLFLSTLCLLIGVNALVAQGNEYGVLPGNFSVSATKQVRFSKGNLRFRASTNTWRFADNQYDFIATGNDSASATYNNWIDLFGYGTSGWRKPGDTYQNYMPWSETESLWPTTGDHYAYLRANLRGEYAEADWGVHNAIENGGNRPGLWRVLSKDEWDYLLFERTNSSNLRFKVRINSDTRYGMGLLLFPDGTTVPSYLNANSSPTSDSHSGNDLTWNQYYDCVNNYGAVFLPAAGLGKDYGHSYIKYVHTTSCDNDELCEPDGSYWTSDYEPSPNDPWWVPFGSRNHSEYSAYRVLFWDSHSTVSPEINYNCSFHKYSVRLVTELHEVKYYNYDGSLYYVEYVATGDIPQGPANDPTKPYDCNDWAFANWAPGFGQPITGDTRYDAQFNSIGQHDFTIAFHNYTDDPDSIRYIGGFHCGDTIKANFNPYRAPEDTVVYQFQYWYKYGEDPSTPYIVFDYPDTVVSPWFRGNTRYFTITWLNDEGDTLYVDNNAEYNKIPRFVGDTTKPSTCDYEYTFTGWSPKVVPATADATYTQTFSSKRREYTVRWLNYNHRVLEVDTVICDQTPVYSGATPTKPSDSRYIYFFDGWAPEVGPVNSDTQFVAQFRKVDRYYDVTIVTHVRAIEDLLDDPTVIYRDTVIEYGGYVNVLQSDTTRFDNCGYHNVFSHWMALTPTYDTLTNVNITDSITQDLIFVAQYTSNLREYKMTWVERGDTTVNLQYYDSPLDIPVPALFGRDSIWEDDSIYVFNGWVPALNRMPHKAGVNVVPCGDTTFTAKYTVIPRRYDIVAIYQDSIENVLNQDTFKLEFGSELNFDNLAKDREYCDKVFKFTGWDPELQIVTNQSDKVFYAQYNESPKYHYATWINWTGDTISRVPYRYQQKVTVPADPARPAVGDSIYFFTGWTPSPELSMPCQDMTYTATFQSRVRLYIDTIVLHDTIIYDTVPFDSMPKVELYANNIVRCDSTFYFLSWTPKPDYQDTVSVKYVANYLNEGNKYSVTWKDWNGRTLYVQALNHDSLITVPANPTRPIDADNVYFFTGWLPTPQARINCANQEYEAQYRAVPRQYMDTIIVLNDTLFGPTKNDTLFEPVIYGNTPDLTKYAKDIAHCDSTFTFSGWEPALQTQDTAAVKYVAKYNPTVNKHTVVWKDWNGSTLDVAHNNYDSAVVLPATPDTYRDAQYVYFFKEWSPAPVATKMPCNDLEYFATYDKYQRYYNDTIVRLEDTLFTDPIEYGTTPDLKKYQNDVLHCDTLFQFAGWSPEPQQQGVDTIKYVALYDTILNLHSVTWRNYDNSNIRVDYIHHDSIIVAPKDPVRDRDNNYVYIFNGWKPTFVENTPMPCADLIYTADYRKVARYYGDTVVLKDTTIFETVEYGQTPDLTKYQTPVVHCDSTYIFKEWSPVLAPQGEDTVTYTAVYTSTVNKHNVTWLNWDNTTYQVESYNYDSAIVVIDGPVRSADNQYVYFFDKWYPTPASVMPCEDVTYKATYTTKPRYYADTIVLKDTIIYEQVEYGKTPSLSLYETPVYHCDSTYEFLKWNPTVEPQGGDTVKYTAVYKATVNKHNVTWLNWDNTPYQVVPYNYDSAIVVIDGPVRSADAQYVYFFDKWNPTPAPVMPCVDVAYQATYTYKPRFYNDTIILKDTTVIEQVEYGKTPDLTKYETPVTHCDFIYTFKVWSPVVAPQGVDTVTYVAVYDSVPNKHLATWLNWDNSTVDAKALEFGEVIVDPTTIPTRPSSGGKVYFFTGWDPDTILTMPCNDVTFKAQFTDKEQYYLDTIVRKNDTVFVPVPYDSTPDLTRYENTIYNCDSIYTFKEWFPPVQPQIADTVKYVAIYTSDPNMHSVTWMNYDNTPYLVEPYNYDSAIVVIPGPARPKDSQYVYFFKEWSPTPASTMPCNNVTYRPTYDFVPRFYKDTIVLKDTVIYEQVEYGQTPNLTKYATPVHHCDSTYEFKEWSPVVSQQGADTLKYVAVYHATVNKHNVTWLNWDNTTLMVQSYNYDSAIVDTIVPVHKKDAQYIYFFKGWNPTPDATMPCYDVTYKAVFDAKPLFYKDTIVLKDTVIYEQVEYGKTPSLTQYETPVTHCDSTYEFLKWSPALEPQGGDTIKYTAVYKATVNKHNVTWLNWDNTTYLVESYNYDSAIVEIDGPARSADNQYVYFFAGWTPAVAATMPCNDVTYKATYTSKPRYYADTIVLKDTVIYEQVEYGKTPSLAQYETPVTHCDSIYTFLEWSPKVEPQAGDTIKYTAVYKATVNKHNVTWLNWDNTTYLVESYNYDSAIVEIDGPARSADNQYVYFFAGWTPAVAATMPCNDVTYKATYTSKPRYYADTIVLKDTVIYEQVEYGKTPSLAQYETPVTHCDSIYTFKEWSPKVEPQAGDTVKYTAIYRASVNMHTVTWKNWNTTTYLVESYNYDSAIVVIPGPTRPSDGQYVYFFTGWNPTPDAKMPCNDVAYTAMYDSKPLYYTDTIVLLDTTMTIQVEYGKTPDLTKYAIDVVKCEKTYTFKGWSPAVTAQGTTNVTYAAVYDSVINQFSVTWNKWDGSLIDAYTQQVGTPIVAPTDTARPRDTKVYTFVGWSPSLDTLNLMPCRDLVFNPQYTSVDRYYRDTVVTFGDVDTVITVEYGDTPDLTKYQGSFSDCSFTYNFREWNPAVGPQGDVVINYVADYDTIPNKYVATFLDYKHDTLQSDSVLYGDPIVAPTDTARPMDNKFIYVFNGWSPAVDSAMPCHNTEYIATYREIAREFVDTVVLHDTTILITLHYGETPDLTQYEDTAYDCNSIYIFHNWKPAPKPQGTTPVRYEAYYTSTFRTYTVTWNNYNGSIYHLDTLQNGALVSVPVPNPVRLPDSTNIYFFDHWNPTPALTLSCKDLVYTAVFDSYPRFYDVPVHTLDTTDTLHNVQFGQTPDLSAYEDTVVHCDYTYIFDSWTPPVGPKGTDSVEYTAHYRQVANMYNVIWKNDYDTFAVTRATYGSPINGPRRTDTPTRPATQDSIYTFSGWQGWSSTSKPIMDNCGDTVFYATYTAKSAFIVDTIVLKDTVLFDTVPYDSTAILTRYEGTVVHCDYTYIFDHWSPNPDSTPQPGYPISFTAVYTPVLNDYYITWMDADSVLRVDTLHCGAIPAHDPPMRDATCDSIYVFSHWTPQIVPVSANATYTAVFNREQRFHAITWYDAFGNVSYVDSLACDSMPVPTCQFIDGGDSVNYRLSGWLPAIHNVDGNESYYPVFDSEERIVTCDSTLNFTVCPGDTVTLPSGRVMVVNADEMVIDTVIDAIRKPYETLECYNNDSLVDLKVYVISVANFKNPLVDDHSIACPDRIVEGKAVKTGQTEMDIKAAFTGAAGELVPDWTSAQWMILDVNGNWVAYNNEEIRDREAGDTIRMKYVIPTNCQPIIVDLNAFGCDMSVHKSNADNCEQCQSDSAVIAVYDWLLMYEHAMMLAKGYDVTPDKVYWFAIGGDDWDNLDEWVIPMAIDDKYLGNGYYRTLNQPFNGTGDYYALVDVTNAGPKTQPCLGIMRSRKFRYTVAPANAPAAQIYPTKVSNSETVFVTGLQSNVKNEIYVYDASGKLVSHDTVTDDHYEFRAAGAAGTYRVVVITENDKQTLSFIIL